MNCDDNPDQVFMSHSRKDKNGRTFFDGLFSRENISSYWYSYEGPSPPHAERLKNCITRSVSVFVLLSQYMNDNLYTLAWISYEVGAAYAAGKKIWVFHKLGDEITFPVPYVTAYIERPRSPLKKREVPYSNIVQYKGQFSPESFNYGLENGLLKITCANPDCKASYHVYIIKDHKFRCPVCGNVNKLKEVIEK